MLNIVCSSARSQVVELTVHRRFVPSTKFNYVFTTLLHTEPSEAKCAKLPHQKFGITHMNSNHSLTFPQSILSFRVPGRPFLGYCTCGNTFAERQSLTLAMQQSGRTSCLKFQILSSGECWCLTQDLPHEPLLTCRGHCAGRWADEVLLRASNSMPTPKI
jgi:hypothetical protein